VVPISLTPSSSVSGRCRSVEFDPAAGEWTGESFRYALDEGATAIGDFKRAAVAGGAPRCDDDDPRASTCEPEGSKPDMSKVANQDIAKMAPQCDCA